MISRMFLCALVLTGCGRNAVDEVNVQQNATLTDIADNTQEGSGIEQPTADQAGAANIGQGVRESLSVAPRPPVAR